MKLNVWEVMLYAKGWTRRGAAAWLQSARLSSSKGNRVIVRIFIINFFFLFDQYTKNSTL